MIHYDNIYYDYTEADILFCLVTLTITLYIYRYIFVQSTSYKYTNFKSFNLIHLQKQKKAP